jgi:hypothetical protein
MKIQKSIKIGGQIWKIVYENLEEKGNTDCGDCIFKKQIICIDKEQCVGQQESTLIHEILEAINFSNDLRLEHQVISVLEASLYQVLKDNNLLK